MTKIVAKKKRGEVRPRIGLSLSPSTDAALKELHAAYADLLGREVGNSIIVRRALDDLKIKVRNMDPADADAEAAALMKVTG